MERISIKIGIKSDIKISQLNDEIQVNITQISPKNIIVVLKQIQYSLILNITRHAVFLGDHFSSEVSQ
jgi:hypothetical protein